MDPKKESRIEILYKKNGHTSMVWFIIFPPRDRLIQIVWDNAQLSSCDYTVHTCLSHQNETLSAERSVSIFSTRLKRVFGIYCLQNPQLKNLIILKNMAFRISSLRHILQLALGDSFCTVFTAHFRHVTVYGEISV